MKDYTDYIKEADNYKSPWTKKEAAFMDAIHADDPAAAKMIFEKYPTLNVQVNNNYALCLSIASGHNLEFIDWLLERGADIKVALNKSLDHVMGENILLTHLIDNHIEKLKERWTKDDLLKIMCQANLREIKKLILMLGITLASQDCSIYLCKIIHQFYIYRTRSATEDLLVIQYLVENGATLPKPYDYGRWFFADYNLDAIKYLDEKLGLHFLEENIDSILYYLIDNNHNETLHYLLEKYSAIFTLEKVKKAMIEICGKGMVDYEEEDDVRSKTVAYLIDYLLEKGKEM